MGIAPNGTVWIIVEWIIRLGALAVVPRRRAPAATASWLLLIFFLPEPGLLLYLMIGRPRFPRWRAERRAALHPFFAAIAGSLRTAAPCSDAGPAAALAEVLGRMPAVGGNTLELIDDYDTAISSLVADIDAARRSVRLLAYIYADDRVGQAVARALARAAQRGVACRVMFDPVGSHHWRHGTLALLRASGVKVREALPFRWLRDRTRRDMRNHRKLFVIDGEVGYIGSQNIVAKDFRPGVVNRELVARVTGPIVASLAAVVEGDWSVETEDEPADVAIPAATGDAQMQLLPSGADFPYQGFETLLVWQLHRAQRRAVIVTPYFIPDEAVLGAMRTAALRGVTVDLIVSAVVDQHLVHLAQCSYYSELLGAGVRIARYPGYLLHAKNVSIDERFGVVGSSNVDIRSFQLNEEASLLLHDEASVTALCRIQHRYLTEAEPIDLDRWRRRGAIRATVENIARLMSPLL